MEWADYQASLCSGCRKPRAECMDPANDGEYEAVPLQCFACAARDAEQRRISADMGSDRFGSSAFDGLFVAITERGSA